MRAYMVETEKLLHNLELLRRHAGETPIWAVVKGNGYGLGITALSRVLRQGGVDRFAVTEVAEAEALREDGFLGDILMLRELAEEKALEKLLSLGVILTLGSLTAAQAAERTATSLGITARSHVKIDTGMGRYGFLPHQWEQAKMVYTDFPHIQGEGIYTHFHTGSRRDTTQAQFDAFTRVRELLCQAGTDPGMAHCCNSLAFCHYPHMHLDGVRLGSCLLGRVSCAASMGLQPVGYCQATVEAVKTLPKGHNVGYGSACQVKRQTQIAVVPVGYLHGFSVERGYDVYRAKDCLRSMGRYFKYMLQGKSLTVEIKGKPCRVLGHVGMMNLIADVTGLGCQVGDPVRVKLNPLDLKETEILFR